MSLYVLASNLMTSASHCSAKYLGVEMTTTRHSMLVSNTKQSEFGDICPESTDAGLRPMANSYSLTDCKFGLFGFNLLWLAGPDRRMAKGYCLFATSYGSLRHEYLQGVTWPGEPSKRRLVR